MNSCMHCSRYKRAYSDSDFLRLLSTISWIQATLEETRLNPATIDDICVGGLLYTFHVKKKINLAISFF